MRSDRAFAPPSARSESMAAAWDADESAEGKEVVEVEGMSASDGALPGGLTPEMVQKLSRSVGSPPVPLAIVRRRLALWGSRSRALLDSSTVRFNACRALAAATRRSWQCCARPRCKRS